MDVADPPTDAALAARPDRAAFDQLVDRHARPVAAWLLRHLPPPDAEHVLPAVLRRARRAAGTFRGDDYRAWLFQIARATLADWRRRNRPAEAGASNDDADRAPLLPTLAADPADLPGWLERLVAGPDLGRLIAELSAARGPATDTPDLAAALGPDRAAVLANGLGVLPEDRLRAFLRHPPLLAELQDVVAEAGGPYWDDRFDHPTLARMVRQARTEAFDADRPRDRRRGRWYRRPWFVALATASLVLLTVILNRPPGPPAWGWARPGAVTRGETCARHLTALADAAAEWDARPRQTPAELRRALWGMRDGCTAVLAARHDPLTGDDRAWLVDRCVAWGAKLDRHLADLQTGRPADEVRPEADATVAEVVRELRERAGDS